MGTPHKHRDVIIAWANGREIEYEDGGKWYPTVCPDWYTNVEYRIKPKPEEIWEPTMELRNVRIGATDLYKLQQKHTCGTGTASDPYQTKWVDIPTVGEEG